MEFGEKSVTSKGLRLSARTAGKGPPIVLFHSLLAGSFSFEPLAKLLAPTHTVYLIDLPGFGDSSPVSAELQEIAQHLSACIPELVEQESTIVIGNGFGGFVALSMAIHSPALPDRLILADCGACFTEPGREAFRMMSRTAREKGLEAIANVAMKRLFAESFMEANPALASQCRNAFLSMNQDTFHGACKALSELDLRPQLSRVRAPTLVMVGELDEATPPPMGKELSQGIPGALFKMLPGCAHVPQLQDPGLFHREVMDFLGQK